MSAHPQPPPQAVANLPVLETLTAAFAAAYSNPALLLRAAAGGLLLLAVPAVIFVAAPNSLTALLVAFAPVAAYSHFGVNWYRIVLLGPAGLVRPTLRWDRRHWRFFGYAVAFGVAFLFLYIGAAAALPFLPGAVVAIVLWYLSARVCFIFPSLAVEEPYSLALAWRHTRGQGLRLTAALLLAAIPLSLAVTLIVSQVAAVTMLETVKALAALQGNGLDPESPEAAEALAEVLAQVSPVALVAVNLTLEVLSMAVLAVLYSIVALAFRTCTGWVPAAPGNLPAAPNHEGRGNGDGGH